MIAVTNEFLGTKLEFESSPPRVVSLVSAATETIERVGRGSCVVGTSAYCDRYVDLTAPVVGEYTTVDFEAVEDLEPELVLVTTGIQMAVARRLADRGLPVYSLPLPGSINGALENMITVSALVGSLGEGRRLVESLASRVWKLRPGTRRSTYVEIWFGRHMRTIGGRSFISDIVQRAGGDAIYSDQPYGYARPDFDEVASSRPEVMVALSEPEYPVDFDAAIAERGWTFLSDLVVSDVTKGQNIIHDGPSIADTIEWLHQSMSGD